jgi:hypothetical protein
MQVQNENRKTYPKQDLFLSVLAFCIAILATLDPMGTRLTLAARAGMLAAASLLAARPLFRLFGGGAIPEGRKRAVLVFIFAVHLAATLFFFPAQDLLNDKPVITLDHTFHHYQVVRARAFFWQTGRLHGYDPYFMAGYPGGALFDLDMKGAELFCALFGFAGARALKFFILLIYLAMVFTVYKGCRLLRFTFEESVIGVMILLVYWHWGRPYASHFRYAGMFDFIFVSHLSILLLGVTREFLRGRKILWFFVLGPLTFLVHPTAVVIVYFPTCILLVSAVRRLTRRTTTLFILWCGAVLAVNAIWLYPMFEYLSVKTPSSTYFQVAGISGIAGLMLRPSGVPAIIMVVFAITGFLWMRRSGSVRESAMLGAAAVFLFAMTGYGIYVPGLKHMEPGRFLLSAMMMLAPFAGAGLRAVFATVEQSAGKAGLWAMLRQTALVLLLLSPLFLSLMASRTKYQHRITTRFSPEVASLIEAVGTRVDRSGRLMVEDGPALLYGGAHVPGMLPLLTGVEQIGGPYPYTFISHHFATFQLDKTMGRPLAGIPKSRFQKYMDLYNIRWILTASQEAGDYMGGLGDRTAEGRRGVGPDAEGDWRSVWQSGRYTLWQSRRTGSFVEGGNASVDSGYNVIAVRLRDTADVLVLKYHWDERLRVTPPARISPVHRMDDPIPFIRLEPGGMTEIFIRF